MSYVSINDFGSDDVTQNPLIICTGSGLDSGFNNDLGGGLLRPDGEQCHMFLGRYCSDKWDSVCDVISNDKTPAYDRHRGLASTRGDNLLRETANEKYTVEMSDNCRIKYVPFDPTTAGSPLIAQWKVDTSNKSCQLTECVRRMEVDPSVIDNDPLMNKLLDRPWIWSEGFVNIYKNMKRQGKLQTLNGTRIGKLLFSEKFQRFLNQQ